MSINWQLDELAAPPQLLVLPPDAVSLDEADAAIELWEFYSRKTLDAEQRLTVRAIMALDSNGMWAASTTAREMARQNGKGDEVEVVELWGLVQRAERILHTVHDAVLLATETQQRMLGVIEGHRDLRRLKKRAWLGTGQQMIELDNGGIIWYRTRSGGGGRGVDRVDRLVVDESQHATSEHLAALTPTQFESANPQTNFLGSAGIEGKSRAWWLIRLLALGENPGRLAYIGHTVEQLSLDSNGKVVSVLPENLTDEDLWRQVNPALQRKGEQGLEFLRKQLLTLGMELFAQEHLCVWAPEPDDGTSRPIPLELWDSLIHAQSTPDPKLCRLAIDTNPERTWFTVSLAGERSDGLLHGEITKSHPVKAEAVRLGVEAAGKLGVALTCSEASGLADDITKAGGTADVMSPAEQAAATSKLIDATRGEAPSVRHRGEPAMRRSLEMAQTKPYSDGGITWSRRGTSGDISPLTALTMAFGRLMSPTEAEPEFFVY